MKKLFLYGLAVIIGAGTGIGHYYLSKILQKTTVTYTNNEDSHIILPVEIKGKIYKFVWDTGAGISFISSRITEETKTKATNTSNQIYTLQEEKKIHTIYPIKSN